MTHLAPEQEIAQAFERWETDPIAFMVEALGMDPALVWSAMEEMAESVQHNRRTAVAGCHSSSKTYTAAGLAWWWVVTKPRAVVYITAPKEDQVRDVFWRQLRDLHDNARFPVGGEMLSLEWKHESGSLIVGRTSRKDSGPSGATGMQGYKSEHLLLIFDEAVGIDRAFFESAPGILTFPENRWLALANPTNPNCGFRDCWRAGSGWTTINIDALANPNLQSGSVVHPYLATPEWVAEMLAAYGDGSPSYESRVRGRFPDTAVDTLISLADIYAARDREPSTDPETWVGVDLARQGDDFSVVAVVRGDELIDLEWFQIPDLTRVIDATINLCSRHDVGQSRAHQVTVDASGMGWGAYDYARRVGWNVNGEDFGSLPSKPEQWYDRRTEMWVGVRDWLQGSGSLKNCRPDWLRYLEADLSGCTVEFRPKGGVTVAKLEAKDAMKKRLGHSPDHGDALALALAPRSKTRGITLSDLRTTIRDKPTVSHPDDEPDDVVHDPMDGYLVGGRNPWR